ncbi:MAG: carboxypeptidase-like regulatory domain-containing protein [Casimicrobium sp.]
MEDHQIIHTDQTTDNNAWALLRHRFVLLPLAVGAVVAVWNVYVATHDDGIVRGRVVSANGQPVADAIVKLNEQNFTTNSERGQTTTRADGSFEFTDNRSHSIQLRAEKLGVGRSELMPFRLYFRAQNLTLGQPLLLQPARP